MFPRLHRARRARRGRRRPDWRSGTVEVLELRTLLCATAGDVWRFDFGTTSSPIEAGYTRVTHLDSYDASDGYGWLSSPVFSASRSGGTALTRDLNFSRDMTFAVDLAAGTYDVTLTIGDLFSFHDRMGVFLEGGQHDEISTLGGQVLVRSYTVHVADGPLTLRLQDLGGSDVNAVINGLEIRPAPPDTAGPRIIDARPIKDGFGYVSGVQLEFDEPIRSGTFTVADVVSLEGPDGGIAVAQVQQLDLTHFEILFAEQRMPGEYTLVLAPDITDISGNLLDQDGDGLGGEPVEDRFTFLFDIEPLAARFDFGTATSPVEPGYHGVDPATAYQPLTNFGWLSGSVSAVQRPSGTALTRDLNFSGNATFGVDVANAVYEVTVFMGDTGNFAHDQMGVFLEGTQVDTVSSAPGQVVLRTYQVSVSDGQLTLRLADLGGSDLNAVINGLEVRFLGTDVTGPRVVGVSPGEVVIGSFDRVTLTFDEAIRNGTFTLEDVASFVGPAGTIAPIAVNRLSDVQYEVVFDRQFAAGDYTLAIGPAIEDLAGNRMDQDGDGTNGEAAEDRFTATFLLDPFLVAFDFGTATSPVAAGFIRVTPGTVYNAEVGHGWLSGIVLGADRTTGTDLTRDLNFTELATFAVDGPTGTYGVTLTLGDTGAFGHDQMGIFLEGVQVDSVSTGPRQVVTRTYQIEVSDGQLTLLLDDLGGSDRNVVINGLELVLLAGVTESAPLASDPAIELPASSRATSVARVPDRAPSWTPAAAKFNGASPGNSSHPGAMPAAISDAVPARPITALAARREPASRVPSSSESSVPGHSTPGHSHSARPARAGSAGGLAEPGPTSQAELAALDSAFATRELADELVSLGV